MNRLRIRKRVNDMGWTLSGMMASCRGWVKADENIDYRYRAVARDAFGQQERLYGSVLDAAELPSNFGATTPKYDQEPGIIRDQKTKPGTTTHDPVRSEKPPSPVQIRAAPPNLLEKFA